METVLDWKDTWTIDAADALSQTSFLLQITNPRSFAGIFTQRNRAVHMGIEPEDLAAIKKSLALWLKKIDAKAGGLENDVKKAVNKLIVPVATRVKEKLEAARLHRESDPNEDSFIFLAELQSQSDIFGEDKCPACGKPAGVMASVTDVELEWEGPGDYFSRPIYEQVLYCPYCQLQLDDLELQVVDAAKLLE